MNVAEAVRESLCRAFCQDAVVLDRGREASVSLPLIGRDGDHFMAYVGPVNAGWRVSDKGVTMMRLSYENDLPKLFTGAREKLYQSILAESGLNEDDGELFVEVARDELTHGLFRLGQGITRIEDVSLWTRTRIHSTFMDDLRSVVVDFVGADKVIEDYTADGVENGEDYPIDFYIQGGPWPLYMFGVGNRDKARLATIVLQHLTAMQHVFDSIVVCSDIDSLPSADRRRLLAAANDTVADLDGPTIKRKIEHRLRAA